MIMPTKHINFSESLLGFGSYVLELLTIPKSIDEIWRKYQSDLSNGLYFARHSFDNLTLTIMFLYTIDAINEDNGKITKCNF